MIFTIPPEVWGILSVILAVVSLAPYVWSIFKGQTKPYLFTWIIWTLLTAIAFALQYTEGAGAGAWSGFVSTIFCIVILIAAIKYGEKHITLSDWIVFIAAMAAIPIWLLTENAVLAVIWVTAIDSAGFIPTMRKSWIKPYEEMITTHTVSFVKHICVLFAVQDIHFATIFYSWGMLVMNGLLVAMLVFRRWVVSRRT